MTDLVRREAEFLLYQTEDEDPRMAGDGVEWKRWAKAVVAGLHA